MGIWEPQNIMYLKKFLVNTFLAFETHDTLDKSLWIDRSLLFGAHYSGWRHFIPGLTFLPVSCCIPTVLTIGGIIYQVRLRASSFSIPWWCWDNLKGHTRIDRFCPKYPLLRSRNASNSDVRNWCSPIYEVTISLRDLLKWVLICRMV